MSIRTVSASPTTSNAGLSARKLATNRTPWVRNPSWGACEANAGDNRVRGLYAVFPEGGNFIAMTVAGAYTVNYGDGTTTNYTSGTSAYYEYDYNDADLVGTEAPVTFTDTGDLVTRTAHGYTDGMTVQFFNIVTTTGISEAQFYYVINATANTFQVSSTVGGSAIALTNDGTGQLLPYRIATVTITPQGGSNLTSVNLFVKHNKTNLQAYSTGWLDIAIASSTITSLTIGINSISLLHYNLERVRLNQLGAITSFSDVFSNLRALKNIEIASTITSVTNMAFMFINCSALQTVPLFNTASVTDMNSMFTGCLSLTSIPLFNTASVTNMSNMFNSCSSLTSIPLFNTASVTNMSSMFQTCSSLTSVPLFNTASVTNMSNMFLNCSALQTVPLFNTASVTDMNSMFTGCLSLTSIPLFNTASVTNMSSMFQACSSLTSVPLFNTIKVTSMSNMFYGCISLTSVPLFNTEAVLNMGSMFNSCSSLTSVPLFNTIKVTNMGSMFSNCYSLTTVPLFNTASVTAMNNMFNGCNNLVKVPALITTACSSFTSMFNTCTSLSKIEAKYFLQTFSVQSCKLSRTALEEIFTNLPTPSATRTLTVTSNYGVDTAVSKSVTTTAQSVTIPMTDTSGMVVGQFVTGTRTGITTGVSVTSDVTANTFTLTAHGLTNGKQVSFSTLGTTTGISAWTIYFVVNATANTFQVALTDGGAAIDLTGTNSTLLNVRYPSFITAINPGVSVTLDTPAATSGSGTLTFRLLNSASALLKRWTITF